MDDSNDILDGIKINYREGVNVLFRNLNEKESKTWKEGQDLTVIPENIDENSVDYTKLKINVDYHVSEGSKPRKKGDYFISLSKSYICAFLKYAHGLARLTKDGNKTKRALTVKQRNRTVLVTCNNNEIKDPKDSGIKVGDFIDCQNLAIDDDKKKNYVPADKEIDAFGKIDKERIREVHPLLCDMMMILDLNGKSEYKNLIIEKVVNREFAVETIEAFLLTIKESGKYNDIEKEFAEMFYNQRMYSDDIVDKLTEKGKLSKEVAQIKQGNKNTEDRNKVVFGNCMRNELAYKLLDDFFAELLPDMKKPEIKRVDFPQEIDCGMTSKVEGDHVIPIGEGNLQEKDIECPKPHGINYVTIDEDGEKKVLSCSAKVLLNNNRGTEKIETIKSYPLKEISKEDFKKYIIAHDISTPFSTETSFRKMLYEHFSKIHEQQLPKKIGLGKADEYITADPFGRAINIKTLPSQPYHTVAVGEYVLNENGEPILFPGLPKNFVSQLNKMEEKPDKEQLKQMLLASLVPRRYSGRRQEIVDKLQDFSSGKKGLDND